MVHLAQVSCSTEDCIIWEYNESKLCMNLHRKTHMDMQLLSCMSTCFFWLVGVVDINRFKSKGRIPLQKPLTASEEGGGRCRSLQGNRRAD